jgi:S-formylglutathione hydrolase FrmB
MPDGFTRYGGSQYMNSPAVGRYEDHLIQELVPYVDRRFRTTGARAGRGIMGHSSGGYAALVHGMRHPDVFSAVACHSGDMYFDVCYRPDLPKLFNAIRAHGSVRAFLDQLWTKPKLQRGDFDALNTIAMAACYSPNPENDPPFDVPIRLETGELREDVWSRWLEHDPIHLVERHAAALERLSLLFFDCGLRDEFNLHVGARVLAERLTALGVRHEHEEFDDGHGGVSYRQDVSLPKLAAALGAPAGLDV